MTQPKPILQFVLSPPKYLTMAQVKYGFIWNIAVEQITIIMSLSPRSCWSTRRKTTTSSLMLTRPSSKVWKTPASTSSGGRNTQMRCSRPSLPLTLNRASVSRTNGEPFVQSPFGPIKLLNAVLRNRLRRRGLSFPAFKWTMRWQFAHRPVIYSVTDL